MAPRFGIYFYPWYQAKRWAEAECRHVPQIGQYDSHYPAVIEWQLDRIAACGFDYVVIETVLPGDWCHDYMVAVTDRVIEGLKRRGMAWTFLVDVFVLKDSTAHADKIISEIESYRANGWLEGLPVSAGGPGLIFTFGASPETALKLNKHYAGQLNFVHVAWFRHWGVPDAEDSLPVFEPYNEYLKQFRPAVSYQDGLKSLRFAPFWQETEQILEMNGVATACPGYDDLLLRRNPQLAPVLERHDGATLKHQLAVAVASGAREVLVYSWNEYFEASTIEPCNEFGDLYTDVVREFIAGIRSE